jgi:hypothetical protein
LVVVHAVQVYRLNTENLCLGPVPDLSVIQPAAGPASASRWPPGERRAA